MTLIASGAYHTTQRFWPRQTQHEQTIVTSMCVALKNVIYIPYSRYFSGGGGKNFVVFLVK